MRRRPNATDGALEVARRLAAAPPEVGTRDFDRVLADALDAARRTFEYSGPGLPRLHPRRWSLHGRAGGVPRAGTESIRRALAAEPRDRAVGGERDAVALRTVRFPRCDVAGVLTSGGSMANLSAVVTARHTRLGEDFLDGTYYVTDQAHGSNTKAATIAGFGARNLRLVPDRRRPPHGSGRARDDGGGGPCRRAPAVHGDGGRGHDEHRVRSIRSTRSRRSPSARGCGSTSTPPTAGSSS